MNFEIQAKTLPYQRSLFKTLHPKNVVKLADGFRRVNWQPSNSFDRHVIVTFKTSQPRPSRCTQFRSLGSALRASNAPLSTTASHRITPPAKLHPSLGLLLIGKNTCNDWFFGPLFNFSPTQPESAEGLKTQPCIPMVRFRIEGHSLSPCRTQSLPYPFPAPSVLRRSQLRPRP